nr:hypothetical protein [Haloferax sulfurifontis]
MIDRVFERWTRTRLSALRDRFDTMRIPLPKHTLVALALVGALLTTVVAAGLVSPTLLPGTDTQTPTDHAATASADDAPTPNPDFTPAVQSNGDGDGDEEHEEYDGDEEHGEYDDEEHEYEHEGDDD